MAINIVSKSVKTIKQRDPKTGREFFVTQVCFALENTETTKEVVEIDIKARAKRSKFEARKVIGVVCRRNNVTIDPRKNLPLGSCNGYKEICCDVPDDIAADVENFGGDYVVAVGRTRGSDGDVSDTITTAPVSLPTRVSMISGQRLRYSDLVGVGFEETGELTFDFACDFPPGWQLRFMDSTPANDYPTAVLFEVDARPGAYEGEMATLIVRTYMQGREDVQLMVEESSFQFIVGSQPACCACGGDGDQSVLNSA
ncbi:MAG: hypothetical protein AB1631_23935 [Acidobacteriota bacterium]